MKDDRLDKMRRLREAFTNEMLYLADCDARDLKSMGLRSKEQGLELAVGRFRRQTREILGD